MNKALIFAKQDKNSLTQNNTQALRFKADFCSCLTIFGRLEVQAE
jgi:hypothetical protein